MRYYLLKKSSYVEDNDRFFNVRANQANAEADTNFTGSALRTLKIAEILARDGPLSLKDLSKKLPFHRSSIWRALDVLRRQGWVRTQLGGKLFEISNQFRNILDLNSHGSDNTEEIDPILSFILDHGLYHIDYGCFKEPGNFVLLESSRGAFTREERMSLTDDNLAIAAQLHMPSHRLKEHLDAFIFTASNEERLIAQSNSHFEMLKQYRPQNQVWDDEGTEVSVCLSKLVQRDCAIKISLKTPSIKNKKGLTALTRLLINAFNLTNDWETNE